MEGYVVEDDIVLPRQRCVLHAAAAAADHAYHLSKVV